MATESFLLHDGSQTVSVADYRNSTMSGSTRVGPSGSGQYAAVHLSTATDRTVGLTTAVGQSVYGILQNKPNTGDAADVGIFGLSKMVSGSTAIASGMDLEANSDGSIIPFSAGAGVTRFARSLEAATAVGQVFTGLIYSVGGVGSTA